jgi:hypothetical protein
VTAWQVAVAVVAFIGIATVIALVLCRGAARAPRHPGDDE